MDNDYSNGIEYKNQRQYFLYGILGVVALCVFSFTIAKNNLTKVISLTKANQQKKESLSRLNTKLSYLRSLNKLSLAERIKTIEAVFPSEKPVMNLINSLKNVAMENNVSFGGISLRPGPIVENKENKAAEVSTVNNIELGITVTGSIENVFKYIDKIDKTSPLATVNSLSISSFSKDQSDIINASIDLIVYYQPPPTSIGAVDSTVAVLTAEEEKIFDQLNEFIVYPAIKPRQTINLENEDFFTKK